MINPRMHAAVKKRHYVEFLNDVSRSLAEIVVMRCRRGAGRRLYPAFMATTYAATISLGDTDAAGVLFFARLFDFAQREPIVDIPMPPTRQLPMRPREAQHASAWRLVRSSGRKRRLLNYTRMGVAAVALLASSLTTDRVVCAQCTYTVELLEKPANWATLVVSDLGPDGSVVGSFKYPGQINHHPFRWSPTTGYEVIAGPSTVTDRQARQVSNNGLIAGTGDVPGFSDETTQFVIWYRGTSWCVPAPDPSMYVNVQDADGDGYVVGSFGSGRLGLFPFASRNGEMLSLPEAIESKHGEIRGTNALGMICGWHGESTVESPRRAFIGTLDAITDLPTIEGTMHPWAVRVTRNGHAALRVTLVQARPDDPLLRRGYFWNGGEQIPLGVLPLPGGDRSLPYDMNEVDQIVGASGQTQGPGVPWTRAILWQSGQLYDLTTLTILPPRSKLLTALTVDDSGNILVDGRLGIGGCVPTGFILHPMTFDAADVTIDCHVDVRDLAVVLQEWGPTADAAVPRADLDGDGVIGPADLAMVLGAWTAR